MFVRSHQLIRDRTAPTDWKNSVRLATAAALPAHTGGGTDTLTASANGALSVDGTAVVVGNRVLIKNEAAAHLEHGIWTARQVGTPNPGGTPWILDRSTDTDESDEITTELTVRVEAGATWAGTEWMLTTPMPITINVTALTFIMSAGGLPFAGAGTLSAIDMSDAAAAGVSNTVPRGDHQHANNMPELARGNAGGQIWTADAAFDPAAPGVPIEVAFIPNNFTAAQLGTVRRTIRHQAHFLMDATDGATTFRLRLRLAPVVAFPVPPVGTVILDTGAFLPIAGNVVSVECLIQVLFGAATFNAVFKVWNESLGTWAPDKILAGAVNTGVANDLVFTGLWSGLGVGNQVTQILNEATLVRE